MSTVTVKMPEKLAAKLEKAAHRRGVPKSKIVVEVLERALGSENEKAKLSAYELMKDGCGVVDSGVPDLGSNKKHFEGFGR